MSGKIHIGTSGWNYKHWKGTFYPEDLPQNKWLDFYKNQLDTVEVNNSFYKLPNKDTLKKWKEEVPKDFIFAAKANRYITHRKKLKEPKDSLKKMLDNFKAFGENLEPILFQLPPNWNFNEERLQNFINELPEDYIYTFEFRDKSWLNDTTYDMLKDRNIALCIYELAGFQSPVEVTADFVYIRLHGPTNQKYQGKYSKDQLSGWADNLKKWKKKDLDVYLYFDNDERGYAAQNAQELKEITD
ncbi:MAG: DUF72 domain-containing protein [Balneolaceae bacterium]